MLKKLWKKKLHGDFTFAATIISVVMLTVIFMGLLYVYGESISRNEVDRVHRKYLLAMEREGYLSSTNMANLTSDLQNRGCSNITISGSLVPVGYGNTITLKVECDLEVEQIVFTGGSAAAGRRLRHIVIEKSGTALY